MRNAMTSPLWLHLLIKLYLELKTTLEHQSRTQIYDGPSTRYKNKYNFAFVAPPLPSLFLKLGKWCLGTIEEDKIMEPPTKVQHCQPERRRQSIQEICEAMYDWFIDVRCTLKARLSKSMFKAQCKIFYTVIISAREGNSERKDFFFVK